MYPVHTLVAPCLGMVAECKELLGKLFTRCNIPGYSNQGRDTWHGQCQSATRIQWWGVDARFRTMLRHAWPEVLDMRATLMWASQFVRLARPHGRVEAVQET